MAQHTVEILPERKSVKVNDGENLLSAFFAAGVNMAAPCGGQGACGRCRVQVRKGDVPVESGGLLMDNEIRAGIRLACQTVVHSDLTVDVPKSSRLQIQATSGTNETVAAKMFPAEEMLHSRIRGHVPAVRQFALELTEPTLHDAASDFTRIARSIEEEGCRPESAVLAALRDIPSALRQNNWTISATVLDTASGPMLTRVRGGRHEQALAVVVDVGTTTIKTELVDIGGRKVLARASEYNRQISFGEDVISRILYAGKHDGLRKLQAACAETVNGLVARTLKDSGRDSEDIVMVTMAGNTTMTHLILGVEPRWIREAPYVPAAGLFPACPASEAGIDVPEGVYLYTFPGIASYVGGDIVAGVLATGIHQSPQMTLYVDIGTNGEIVVGNKEWMMAAACSAGPAFEGGGLRCGMRAAEGAIDEFHIDPKTLEPVVMCVGESKPAGICGSGVIAVLAELLTFGIVGRNGKLNEDAGTNRVRKTADGMEYVIVRGEESAGGKDIVLTDADIDNILRAKAAMYAGYRTLLGHAGLSFRDIERVIITGSFGNYIDIGKAIAIGLFPELPLEKFHYVPNGALLGARAAAYSGAMMGEAEDVARMMTHVDLSGEAGFMDAYMAAMFLPHTDGGEFPEMEKRLAALKGASVR